MTCSKSGIIYGLHTLPLQPYWSDADLPVARRFSPTEMPSVTSEKGNRREDEKTKHQCLLTSTLESLSAELRANLCGLEMRNYKAGGAVCGLFESKVKKRVWSVITSEVISTFMAAFECQSGAHVPGLFCSYGAGLCSANICRELVPPEWRSAAECDQWGRYYSWTGDKSNKEKGEITEGREIKL